MKAFDGLLKKEYGIWSISTKQSVVMFAALLRSSFGNSSRHTDINSFK